SYCRPHRLLPARVAPGLAGRVSMEMRVEAVSRWLALHSLAILRKSPGELPRSLSNRGCNRVPHSEPDGSVRVQRATCCGTNRASRNSTAQSAGMFHNDVPMRLTCETCFLTTNHVSSGLD